MPDFSRSPTRQRILSSINPDRDTSTAPPPPKRRRHITDDSQPSPLSPKPPPATRSPGSKSPVSSGSRVKPLRLKDPSRPRHRHRRRDDDRRADHHRDEDGRRSRSRSRSPRHQHQDRHQHKHRHRHRHRHHRSPTPPDPYAPPPLDPDAAFRESLFDAMADEEGADYWESVYGQPIHIYSQAGELERMDEEEYATYVRRRMWEKTHEGMLEDRELREERRRQAKEEKARERKARRKAAELGDEMEQCLRSGERGRRRREERARWEAYLERWKGWDGSVDAIAWPVVGHRNDINEASVRRFFTGEGGFMDGDGIDNNDENAAAGIAARIREERVRWHPDKMQQRLGGKVDAQVMRDITAVFQIVDNLWAETKAKTKMDG